MANLEVGMLVRILDGSEAEDYAGSWYEAGMREFVGEIHCVSGFKRKNGIVFEDIPYTWDSRYVEIIDKKEIKAMETIMNKTSNFKLTADQRSEITDEAIALLSKYEFYSGRHYEPTKYGIGCQLDEWQDNKGWLVDLFRKHPYYNGKGQIVLTEKYSRKVDANLVYTFGGECASYMRRFNSQIKSESVWDVGDEVTIQSGEGKTNIWCEGMNEYIGRKEKVAKKEFGLLLFEGIDWYFDDACIVEKKEGVDKPDPFTDKQIAFFQNLPLQQYADEEVCEVMNEAFPWLKAHTGGKVSRLVNRICKKYNFADNIDDFSRKYTVFADAINPLDVTRYTVISVHPIDYYTMSYGKGWTSCHSFDKTNIDGTFSGSYHGCYSGGELSYMLDESSFIVYIIDKTYNGTEWELQPKLSRQMFHIGEDKLIQGRLYPQDNDTGAEDTYKQIRNIVQRVIAECYEVNNSWSLSKGTTACCRVINGTGAHYPDYEYYGNCNVSYLKRDGDEKNMKMIHVGHVGICPTCGCEHSQQEFILCEDCAESYTCDRCGCSIGINGIETVDGNHYCDSDCAGAAGYVYCVNTEEWRWEDQDGVIYDNWSNEYYYVPYGDYIETEDGNTYIDEYNAEHDGYRMTVSGEWYREDEVYYCERCEEYVHVSDWNEEKEMCNYCAEKEVE